MTSSREGIISGLKDRMESITTANGYDLTVKKVHQDEIPNSLNLEPRELPSISILEDDDPAKHEKKDLDMAWLVRLHLTIKRSTDAELRKFERAVCKAIWANHPTFPTETNFRFHPSIVWVELLSINSDLNMLDANRVSEIEIIVHHRHKLYDL